EGMPAKDAPFVVKNGKADIDTSDNPVLKNGDFEQSRGDVATGWSYQDEPGKYSFIDHDVKHSGTASLRFGTAGATLPAPANWRINQKLTLKPWRYYRLSFWVKTQDLS